MRKGISKLMDTKKLRWYLLFITISKTLSQLLLYFLPFCQLVISKSRFPHFQARNYSLVIRSHKLNSSCKSMKMKISFIHFNLSWTIIRWDILNPIFPKSSGARLVFIWVVICFTLCEVLNSHFHQSKGNKKANLTQKIDLLAPLQLKHSPDLGLFLLAPQKPYGQALC